MSLVVGYSLSVQYGPIVQLGFTVGWTAPAKHSQYDTIALYQLHEDGSKEYLLISLHLFFRCHLAAKEKLQGYQNLFAQKDQRSICRCCRI